MEYIQQVLKNNWWIHLANWLSSIAGPDSNLTVNSWLSSELTDLHWSHGMECMLEQFDEEVWCYSSVVAMLQYPHCINPSC